MQNYLQRLSGVLERILIQSDFDKLEHRQFINLWMQAYYRINHMIRKIAQS